MYELIEVTKHCYYIQSPAKIGILKIGENDVCLIDSGNDKDAGKRVKKHLDANGWSLNSIFNTHSHADHIGGNQYLQAQTGCSVYAPGIECGFTNSPILEPSFLFGANPPKDLRHKFLMAKESKAEPLLKESLPAGLTILPLPGHTFDMVGFRTEDDIVFLADCLSGKETLDKYHIGYIYDIADYLKTLEEVEKMEAALFIPSHAEPTENIAPLAAYNRQSVLDIAAKIVELCIEPRIFEDLLTRLFNEYALTMSMEQYVLVGSTVRSYLTYLKDRGEVNCLIEDNRVLWVRC